MTEAPLTPMNVSPLNKITWWGVFGLSSYLLSLVFQGFKLFTVAPTLENGLVFLGAMALLSVSLMVLVYDSYVKEKAKGTVEHPIRLFEWLLARQRGKLKQGGS